MKPKLHIGQNPACVNHELVGGTAVNLDGEEFYRIENHDRLRPFFMTVVSSADHWMFVSSNGALTAGRRNPDLALFPYHTDDKIHDSAEITGSKTILIVDRQKRSFLWEPLSERYSGVYRIQRNLYKNFIGNELIFEEVNLDLDLSFRYGWFSSERFGWIRKAWVANTGNSEARIRLLDGLQNLIPSGIGSQFQLEKSTLIDAYKKNEIVSDTGLGLFTVSSMPVDRPEPAESLKATTVCSVGLDRHITLSSSIQVDRFRRGEPVHSETDSRGERGAYFIGSELNLKPGQKVNWILAADVNQGPSQIAELNRLLRRPTQFQKLLETDIERGTEELRRIVACADGLQKTARTIGDARHFANVLFNVMRGGVFMEGYRIDSGDLRAFVTQANREVVARNASFFEKLEKTMLHSRMIESAVKTGDANLERLCREYLPLTFSRRHGDPSRPWNRFAIAGRDASGKRSLTYEGNWRDIFQNWEALAVSFPGYTASMVCRFVNASTADGYNPYRITRNGMDWETIDPHDPWSHIGYWGDHQIIYLLKLLEVLERHDPETLRSFLTRKIFSYANIPYRIQPYEQLVANPKETVVFDSELDELTRKRVQAKGADGKLIWNGAGEVRLVNLTEKLLVSLLAKFANFVPEAGIWLNTQRPEWNDANNALVGNGVSMVTLYHLRRFLSFCAGVFQTLQNEEIALSDEVVNWFDSTARILKCNQTLLCHPVSDASRNRVLEELGRAGSSYRNGIYANGFSGEMKEVKRTELLDFLAVAITVVDESIRANKRSDQLYHAYNLIKLDGAKGIRIRRLYEMLEGQVAVLSSGRLSAKESLDLLISLKQSALYRRDQHSYLLYPDRQLPRFLEKNIIPDKQIARSTLLQKLISDGNSLLVERDVDGISHFNAEIKNAADASRVLETLAEKGCRRLVKQESALVLEIFEAVFDHQSFTGRSGTFFGYEGLGCIYWHMVSKLLLATQEVFFRALKNGDSASILKQVGDCYYDIRAGIGDCKTPENYGAFPMDPYSHTPGHAGARQPGLTGQVKEDILCRMGELGIVVENGAICFRPHLLRKKEFLDASAGFSFYDVAGRGRTIQLKTGELGFAYCQVPVTYQLAAKSSLSITLFKGAKLKMENFCIDRILSRSVFDRMGEVVRITVVVDSRSLFPGI